MGSGLSLFYAETGGTPVTTREWNLDDENLNKLYIQGDAASTSKTDQKDCKIEWTGVTGLSAEDTVKVTVVQVDIAGTGYSEPNAEEETKGMFIHAKATKTVTLNYYPSDLDYGVLKLAPQESEHLKILVPAETAGEDPLALSTFEWDLAEDEEPPKNLIIEGTKYGEVTLEVEHVQTEAEDKAKTTVFECRVEISAETGEASERLADVVQAPGWIKFERKIKPEGLPEDVKYFAIHLKFETITALPAGGSSNAAKFGADTPSRPAGNGGAAETFAQFWERKNLGKVRPEFIDKDYDLVAQAKGNNAALRAFQAGGGYIDEPSMAIRYKCTGQLNADQTVGMLRLDPVFDWLDEGEKTDFDSPTPESKQGEDAVLELTEASWDGMPGNWDPLAGEETEEDGEGSDEENGGNAESKTTAKIEIKDGAYLCIRTDSNNDGTIDDADDDPDVKNSSDHHGHIMEVNYDDDDKNEKEDRNEFPNVNDYTNESIMRGFAPYVFISDEDDLAEVQMKAVVSCLDPKESNSCTDVDVFFTMLD
ncbi:MAG TPA: hypothetical protein DEB39_00705, partial [Planctomycetaceae bacterium]|nr:hypothetical protein [Planctomycetaceae bacterium]